MAYNKEQKQKYYQEHKERIDKYNKQYVIDHKDKQKEWNRRKYKKNRNKAILIWEKANGKVPDGYLIIHKDKNKNNNNLDNLAMITRREYGTMNLNNLAISNNKEITESNILLAKIKNKIRDLRRTR